jgi:hypothetical protein
MITCKTARRNYHVNEPIDVLVRGLTPADQELTYSFVVRAARGQVATGAGVVPSPDRAGGVVQLFSDRGQPFVADPGDYSIEVSVRQPGKRRRRFALAVRIRAGGGFRPPRRQAEEHLAAS